jgi:lipopolysaccharide export system permease protein
MELKKIYSYVLKEMLPSFLLSLAILTFLFLINKVFLLLDMVMNKKVPLFDTLLLYLSLVPFVLSLTIPMSMMMATLLAFGRMSSDMEVTAFKSSGVHLFHLIYPVLVLGFLMTGVMVYFNHEVLPAANFTFKKIHFKILKEQADIALRERVFINLFEGYQFYIDSQDHDGTFKNVQMFNRVSPHAPLQTTVAQTGRLLTDRNTLQLFFQLNDGVMTWDNINYHTYNHLKFDHYTIHLKLENQLSHLTDVQKDYEEMNLSELSEGIRTSTDEGRRNSLRVEFQKRLSLPFACLALTWFCAPLGLWTRSKGFIGFVLGLSMIFLYYLMFILGEILSGRGLISPVIGVWWANVILTLAGFLIYYLVINEHSAFDFIRNLKRKSSRRSKKR